MAAIFRTPEASAQAWLDSKYDNLVASGNLRLPRYRFRALFNTPSDALGQMNAARSMVQMCSNGEVLLRLSEWYQNIDSGLAYMVHMGWLESTRDLNNGISGAILNLRPEGCAIPIATALLEYLMAFGWEGVFYDPLGASYIWVADEVIEIGSNRKPLYKDVLARFADLDAHKLGAF